MGLRLQLLGLVGSGKSHLAREIAAIREGYVISFAESVYRLSELVKGGPIDKTLPSDRLLLKQVGTTWGRKSQPLYGDRNAILEEHRPPEWGTPDIWANIFVTNCKRLPPDATIVNDDTRFENELRVATRDLSFIPVYIKTSEKTRLARLKTRGDKEDPNDPEHESEWLANILSERVVDESLLPVVWNDRPSCRPDRGWVYSVDEFLRLVNTCDTNELMCSELGWTRETLEHLMELIATVQ